MLGYVGAALVTGLAGSAHCAGMCGGFATACARQRGGVLFWHAGRLTTYAVLGTVAGFFGKILPGPAWVPGALSAVLLVWFALSLAGLLPEPSPKLGWVGRLGARVMRWPGGPGRYAFGLLTGLLPCGMVYVALSVPIALADPARGALAMLAFGVGTVPALTVLPAVLRRLAARGLAYRRALAVVVLAAGLWSIGMRAQPGGMAHGGHAGHGAAMPAHGAMPAPGAQPMHPSPAAVDAAAPDAAAPADPHAGHGH